MIESGHHTYRREGIIIPDFDFITTLLNIKSEEIEDLKVFTCKDSVAYHITLKGKIPECPYCGARMISNGYGRIKPISHPTLIDSASKIMYKPHRYLCKTCKKTITQDNPFTFARFSSSYSLLNTVMNRLGNLNYTLDMISRELNISPTQISTYLDSYITIPRMALPECLGIDEIHNPEMSYKGSSYLCIMVDNEKRCINDVLGSRSKYYLDNYFYTYTQEEKDRVRYVTIDMWQSYRDLAYKHFRNCIVAVDPFHVIEHLCKDFKQVRINIMNQCVYNSNAYYLLKKWNWLLEKDIRKVDLDNEPEYNRRFKMKLNRKQILKMILDLSPVLNEAYYLKEKYRSFNRNMSYEEAVENYDALVREFEDANIKEYYEFVNILKNWKTEILNSFLRPYDERKLSNAFSENINGKIASYLIISRGITNFERFRKRVLFALNPRIFYSLTNVLKSMKRTGKTRGPYRKVKE